MPQPEVDEVVQLRLRVRILEGQLAASQRETHRWFRKWLEAVLDDEVRRRTRLNMWKGAHLVEVRAHRRRRAEA
jgi:hypothetical protein